MPTTAIERQNRSGVAPERLDTATERGKNIPLSAEKINHLCHCTTPCPVCFCREAGKP